MHGSGPMVKNKMTTTTDTPRTDACPHCGAEEINPQEEPIRYKCGSKEDGVFSYTCQVNRVVKLEAENVCLQELIQEFYEWSRRDFPTEQEVREIMNRYYDLLNK
jgi:hypothetical protein